MIPYAVKYTESDSDIQNNNLLYKTRRKHKNTFETWKSKSTVYPQKPTRTDVSGHAIDSLNRCASFINSFHVLICTIFLYFFFIYILYIFFLYIYSYLYIYMFINLFTFYDNLIPLPRDVSAT